MPLEIRQNEPLLKHCTFAIGGPAKYFTVARTKEEILEALDFAKKNNLRFFLLGGGSNILFSDDGFDGVVIKIALGGLMADGEIVTAGAGVLLSQIMNFSAENGLSGLEWAVGIPGTAGGAINGNTGAYGKSVSESIERVEVSDENGRIKKYSRDDCHFVYRGSRFKRPDNKETIIEVAFKFDKTSRETAREEIKKTLMTRKGKIPPFPSAGCVFKNIKSETGELIASVGKMADQCGLKGLKIGGAEIPHLHGNYIVNRGGAKSSEVKEIIKIFKERIKERFGHSLEEEIIVM